MASVSPTLPKLVGPPAREAQLVASAWDQALILKSANNALCRFAPSFDRAPGYCASSSKAVG